MRDRDGCSSTCIVEKDFTCTNFGFIKPTKCFYSGNMKISLISIMKADGIDQGILTFKLEPDIIPLS